jgi:hypothetical protein
MQQSSFTAHSLRTPLEETPEASEFLQKLIIPESRRRQFANELSYLGVGVSGIFPDLAHLAAGLVRECEFRKGTKLGNSPGK